MKLRSTFLCACLCGALAAQESRSRLFGKAVLENGDPWPNAAVRIESNYRTPYERLFATDVVEVRTDARGRFEARVLRSRTYRVVARSKSADGQEFRSRTSDLVMAGRPIVLRRRASRAEIRPNKPAKKRTAPALILVRDASTDEPIENATLSMYDTRRHVRTVLGKSDAQGLAVVELPTRGGSGDKPTHAGGFVFARHPDYAEYASHIRVRSLVGRPGRDAMREKGTRDGVIELARGARFSARILDVDGAPLAGVPVLHNVRLALAGGSISLMYPRVFATDAGGRLALPGWNPNCAFRIAIAIPPSVRAHFEPPARTILHPVAIVANRPGKPPSPGAFGDLRMAELVPVDFTVANARERPAWKRKIGVEEIPNGGGDLQKIDDHLEVYFSARGKARLLVPRGSSFAAAVAWGGAYSSAMVRVPKNATEPVPVRFDLPELVVVRGRVSCADKLPKSCRVSFVVHGEARATHGLGHRMVNHSTHIKLQPDGSFVTRLCPGFEYDFRAYGSGYASAPSLVEVAVGSEPSVELFLLPK